MLVCSTLIKLHFSVLLRNLFQIIYVTCSLILMSSLSSLFYLKTLFKLAHWFAQHSLFFFSIFFFFFFFLIPYFSVRWIGDMVLAIVTDWILMHDDFFSFNLNLKQSWKSLHNERHTFLYQKSYAPNLWHYQYQYSQNQQFLTDADSIFLLIYVISQVKA